MKLDLLTTISKAAYAIEVGESVNKSEPKVNGILLGVAGIDVPLQEFMDTARGFQLGPNAYIYAVNNNGFVLFHPRFRPTFRSDIKKYYQNVDISEIEVPFNDQSRPYPDYSSTYRTDLIDRKNGSARMTIHASFDAFRTLFNVEMQHFFTPIENTSFVLGIAFRRKENSFDSLPVYKSVSSSSIRWDTFYPGADYESICVNSDNFPDKGITFCNFDRELRKLYLKNRVCALYRVLQMPEVDRRAMSCNEEFLNAIQADLDSSLGLYSDWASKAREDSKVILFFSMHHSGLVRYSNVTAYSLFPFV
ncbi:Voltage-dependent calcium channel subunit alpha-2/delta-4 [Cichlidogyrus casuarinus]|uniref:Voltage-dependent calcium channel subunit alpha-2/delta-4 n=1 Tax=Cichlidogyrus casuarinus TaxID=1844966 RepID=A0ABD2Q008_9PLAT